ncbi:FadR/GntR family transcriptional regulator [Marinovum sp.]|uniref:FadR/GntR family transcriptional regulator n=1 Tax=Marinovum sp. TaxID=2024839 RepID=UPI002B26C784|nr:FadR/GntR family transcriptional regulator [Marinovum sp.]
MDQNADTTRHTASSIAEALAEDIRTGRIVADTPLPTERELCERFGASRPTVREALMSLQIRGFVSAGNGKRPRASKPSVMAILRGAGEHLRHILGDTETGAYLEQMRQFIEAGAAREAANRATGVQAAKLKVALERNRAAIGTPDFGPTDIAFHQALVDVLGNPVVLSLHEMFVSEVLKLRALSPDHGTDRTAEDARTFEEHRAVYQAILDGDAARATDLLDQHLARSYRKRLALPGAS